MRSTDHKKELPIEAVLPQISDHLHGTLNLVLIAQPGAGKTTRVPLSLLNADWLGTRKIIMLEPRRLAARAAARHMAGLLGENVGETVGYRVRMDTKISAKTRIEIVTDGVFTRMIQSDPELSGIGAIIFDEFHERSLDGDLGLALALDVQAGLRDDLRLVVMSATLDGERVRKLLGTASLVECEGRMFPVETRYKAGQPNQRLEQQMASTIESCLQSEVGSILCFLPGMAEIKRVERLLDGRLDSATDITPLYGLLDRNEQDRAIQPASAGRRKVVLATSIAETSLTIEGIRIVIDSGLTRKPVFNAASGVSRLETIRASKASVNQRRGRAGRREPGLCVRLWHEGQTAALPDFERPEIMDAELTGLALGLLRWGVKTPDALLWLDPPSRPVWNEALALLSMLGLVSNTGLLTDKGKMVGQLPLSPRLASMILDAARTGDARLAARLALLVSERDLGGREVDLGRRLLTLERDRSHRTRKSLDQAERWARKAGAQKNDSLDHAVVGLTLARAFPDRLARRRTGSARYGLSNGRGAFLEETDGLAQEEFLVVADLQGMGADARILAAVAISRSDIEEHLKDQIIEEVQTRIDKATGGLRARRVKRIGSLILSEVTVKPNPDAYAEALCAHVMEQGLETLPWGEKSRNLRQRIMFLRDWALQKPDDKWPDLSDRVMLDNLEDWFKPYLAGKTALSQIKDHDLYMALLALIPWEQQQALESLAPKHFESPTGSRFTLNYAAGAPVVSIRVQELFGLSAHPCICHGSIAITFELLSPAQRPIQITKDLPGFWSGSWIDVAKEMRGRYPKHVWPEDPANAQPTRRAKPRN